MLKKNRPAPPAPPANIETTGGGSSNSNPMVPGELSTHQHQQVLAGADPAAANMVVPGLQHLQQHLQMAKWLCPCGQINFPEKTRCTSCSKWKGGKRGNVPRKATKDPETEQIVAALSKKPPARLAVLPNQPNMPWKCTRCGNDNDMRKLRCGTCQSWKNGKKQLSQRAEMQSLPHATPALDKLLAAPPADGALHRSHWKCHNCHAEVLSTKHRCPSCKSWKGGVRDMGAKKKPSFWTCVCKRQNEEKKARCGGCMRWRGGKRPEALHQQDKVHNGSWVCERCSRPNKKSKVRCGGCQRWRDGMRPDMRKGARAARAAATGPNGPQQFQMLSVKHAPQLPPFHIPQMTLVTGSVAGPVAQPGAQPVPQHPTLLVQVPINPINTIDAARAIQHNLAVQNQAIPVALPAATADRDKTGVAWTCQKCTCDNLATELACKICDSPRESWV